MLFHVLMKSCVYGADEQLSAGYRPVVDETQERAEVFVVQPKLWPKSRIALSMDHDYTACFFSRSVARTVGSVLSKLL